MPKKHGGGGGKISARRGGSANDAAATPKLSTGTSGTTEHSSNPDRGVTASQEAELHRLHDKLCFRLEVETPTVDKVDVVPERPDFLMVYRAVFSPDECAAIIDIIDSVGLNAASKSDLNPRKGEGMYTYIHDLSLFSTVSSVSSLPSCSLLIALLSMRRQRGVWHLSHLHWTAVAGTDELRAQCRFTLCATL
jgi:hypothetical protein